MLFRPSFCANCGDKIDRAEWGLLTSRRFCQVCESEFKGHDLVPKIVVAFGLVIGIFGFGSYLNSGPAASETSVARQSRKLVERPTEKPVEKLPPTAGTNLQSTQPEAVVVPPVSVQRPPAMPPAQKAQPVSVEQHYFCGAETKKGTPCSRKVKGKTRCYQHVGMPAMATAAY